MSASPINVFRRIDEDWSCICPLVQLGFKEHFNVYNIVKLYKKNHRTSGIMIYVFYVSMCIHAIRNKNIFYIHPSSYLKGLIAN